MNGKLIELKDRNGNAYQTYLSHPKGAARGPGVVIGLDIHGMRPLYHEIADHFAEQGYLAAVPDYFWDVERGEGNSFRTTMKFPTLVNVTKDTMEHIRKMPDCNGKIAVTGFCVGGNTAFIGVSRLGADAAAGYYATRAHTLLDEVPNIKQPLILHIAEHDHTYSDEDRDRIIEACKKNPRITTHVYKAPHGFASSSIDKDAQALSHKRTFELFDPLK